MVPVLGSRQRRLPPDRENDDKQIPFQHGLSGQSDPASSQFRPPRDLSVPASAWSPERPKGLLCGSACKAAGCWKVFCRYSFQRLGIPSVSAAHHAVVSAIVPSGIPIVKHYFSQSAQGLSPAGDGRFSVCSSGYFPPKSVHWPSTARPCRQPIFPSLQPSHIANSLSASRSVSLTANSSCGVRSRSAMMSASLPFWLRR